jgi:serine/threonine protein kinase
MLERIETKMYSQTRKARQTFGERQILRWFTEGALALKYMHDKHVLHRDLKSQNLFLTSTDRLRVGDFGISKVLESTAAFARTAIGTPYYLSPEICQEKPYSFGSDIWALGCVVYEMAALRVPFDAQNIQALVQKITRGPLPQVPSNYSQELRQLCGDLLARDQAQRPTATDIIQRRYVQDEIRRMLMEERAKAGVASGTPASVQNGGPQPQVPASGPPGSGAPSRRPASYRAADPQHPGDQYRSAYSPARVYGQAPQQPQQVPVQGQYPGRAGSPGAHRRY